MTRERIYTRRMTFVARTDLKTYPIVIATCCALFVMAGALSRPATPDTGLTEDAVYKEQCAKCHGKTGEGRHFGGPSLLSEKAAAMSKDDLRTIIANGKGHMPKFAAKLKPEQIDRLVDEISAANKK